MTVKLRAARKATALLLGAVASVHAVPVTANGHLFFGDEAVPRDLNGAPYFGFVRNRAGQAIAQAQVTLESKEAKTRVVVQTDTLGHYFFVGFRPDVDPKMVDITCSKAGYRFVSKAPRPPIGKMTPKTPIETNCTLEKHVAAEGS